MTPTILKVRIDWRIKLPTVKLWLDNIGGSFSVVIDTGVKHNLLDPCFFYEWIDYTPPPATSDDPRSVLHYKGVDPPRHRDMGTKRVMCKGGVRRVCRVTKLDFTLVNGADYSKDCSELFAIDPGFCSFFKFKNEATVAGVLGADFLRKHRLVLDFGKAE